MVANRAPTVVGSVDRAAFAVALVWRLRRAGVRIGLDGPHALTRALAACPPDTRTRLYWTTRICLVRRHQDLRVFDTVFAAIFDDEGVDLASRATRGHTGTTGGTADDVLSRLPGTAAVDEQGSGLPWATLPTVVATADSADSEAVVPEFLASRLAGLDDTPFEDLDPEQLALLGGWLGAALEQWPTRRSRRMTPRHFGPRVALRPTLARARRTGWEPIELVRQHPVRRPRRVVMLCDVSRSMQTHATAYLHLMRAVTVAADAEVFAFATSLTRLTPVLRLGSPAAAIDQAGDKVTDRFGGTRIATNVRALLASHHAGSIRGGVVLIASDGWDSDDPAELAAAMERLRRRAYRVIWLNPRAAAPDFAPLVGAMAAALPYCDHLLPAHTPRAMADVVAAVVATARERR